MRSPFLSTKSKIRTWTNKRQRAEVINNQLTTKTDSKQNHSHGHGRMPFDSFVCVKMLQEIVFPQDRPRHEAASVQHHEPHSQFQLLWFSRVSLLSITHNQCCVSGLYHLDREQGQEPSKVKEKPCLKKNKTIYRNPRKTHGGRLSVSPDGQSRCRMTRSTKGQTRKI